MNKKVLISFLLLLCVGGFLSAKVSQSRQVKNLEAFTKLYGYVRFFYPSDEAQTIDWDKFAVHGSERVIKAQNDAELQKALEDLFLPIAPALKIYTKGKAPVRSIAEITPPNLSEWKTTCWQYSGYQDKPLTVYVSRRMNRPITIPLNPMSPWLRSVIRFDLTLENPQIKQYKISCSVKPVQTDTTDNFFGMSNWSDEYYDSLQTNVWQKKEAVFERRNKLGNDDLSLWLYGLKKTLLDSIRVEAKIGNQWQTIYYNDFANDTEGDLPKKLNLDMFYRGYNDFSHNTFQVVKENGNQVLCIESERDGEVSTQGFNYKIFDESVPIGTFEYKRLAGNLYCSFPIALYCKTSQTYPPSDETRLQTLKQALAPLDITKRGNLYNNLGALQIYWNLLQHYYPYWQITDVNWQKELTANLKKTLECRDSTEFMYVMCELMSKTRDGHSGFSLSRKCWKLPGFYTDLVQEKWVVTKILNPAVAIPIGSQVLKIDGKNFTRFMDSQRKYFHLATKPSTDARLFVTVALNYPDSVSVYTFKTPDGKVISRKLKYDEVYDYDSIFERGVRTRVYSDSIFYVNISSTKIGDKELAELLPRLSTAKGIIFDWRIKPQAGTGLISNLLTVTDTLKTWEPGKCLYPDQKAVKTEMSDYPMWSLSPKEPHLNAKIVFLCGPRDLSYEESFLDYIKYYKLGTIIGEPTGGSTGNRADYALPGRYKVSWTGVYVDNPDGSRFHGVGIIPEIIVHPTIKGIAAGRDEIYDTALQYLQKELNLPQLPKEITE